MADTLKVFVTEARGKNRTLCTPCLCVLYFYFACKILYLTAKRGIKQPH